MNDLRSVWLDLFAALPYEGWSGNLYCLESNAGLSASIHMVSGHMAAFSYTLVLEGELVFLYNGSELVVRKGDLFIYSPGMSLSVISATEDYSSLILMADERFSMESPTVRNMVRIAYLPVVRLHNPKISLSGEEVVRLKERMEEITQYLLSDFLNKDEITGHLYAIFLLEVQELLDRVSHKTGLSHQEELFIDFIRLLPEHFIHHRDIGFYAGKLGISPSYLSRIVRQISGRTVAAYLDQFLSMEACFLLRTTSTSIGAISEQLGFSHQAAFCKFFIRMRGEPPREFRKRIER